MMKKFIKRIIRSNWLTDKLIRLVIYVEKERIKRDAIKVSSKFKVFGSSSQINGRITVKHHTGVIIGNNVHIDDNCFLDGGGGIIIGDNTHISRNFALYTTNHHYEGTQVPYNQEYQAKEVIIGRNVWIGINVNITPGVHIGDGAIIGMGSVISKDVGNGEIVISNKQDIVAHRKWDDYLKKELALNYGGINGRPIDKIEIQQFLVSPLKIKKVVFIVSTGRAGSKSMALMFEQNPSISSFHETFYTLLERLSIQYITGRISRSYAKNKLYEYFKQSCLVRANTIYIESDQKLVPFISILADIFDQPKFIWLIRHPKTFMHSAVSRGWFHNDHPQFHKDEILINPTHISRGTRITGDLTGDYSPEDWLSLDIRKKALWYWKYWNRLIDLELKSIPEKNKFFLQLERTYENQQKIMNFIGVDQSIDIDIPRSNMVKKKNMNIYIKTKKKNYEYFEKEGITFVSEEMKKYGYSNSH